MSKRLKTFLEDEGITFWDLPLLTADEILRHRGVWKGTVDEVKQLLAAYGMELGMSAPEVCLDHAGQHERQAAWWRSQADLMKRFLENSKDSPSLKG